MQLRAPAAATAPATPANAHDASSTWQAPPPPPLAIDRRSAATTSTTRADDRPYLPRSALGMAPRALTPVLLSLPPGVPEGRYAAEITLYIDEVGEVRRIRIDTTDLLPELEAQVRQAFMATRFQPGEVNGQAVRARLRVAVEFEAMGPARATGVPAP